MSFRLFTNRLASNGRYFLQCYWKRNINTNILEQTRNRRIPASLAKAGGTQTTQIAIKNPNSGIFRFGHHARKLLIDNILRRETASYSTQIRNEAKKKLLYGETAPFFALVGVTLASTSGILTKEDELEGVCWEIREASLRLQKVWNDEIVSKLIDKNFDIDKLDVGPPIAKGCSAVVYGAAFKHKSLSTTNMQSDINVSNISSVNIELPKESSKSDIMSPIQNLSLFVHKFGGSVGSLNMLEKHNSGVCKFLASQLEISNRAVKYVHVNTTESNNVNNKESKSIEKVNSIRYPLAMKMMFNYDIQSNAMSILRAMYKETVPSRKHTEESGLAEWEQSIRKQTQTLPPHPNIVCMYGYFCGEVRNFCDGHLLYPYAQPPRINPLGYGRNMSLYLLMKRYDCSLKILLEDTEMSLRKRLLLLTQLLEAVTHLNIHRIAHRDIKSDNILIDLNAEYSGPILTLADFGCCLSDKIHGLKIPYTSNEIDKGGNAALMAPEIINKKPGTFSVLNYTKSDLWACGTIAYEIFGLRNPFYAFNELSNGTHQKNLDSSSYSEEDLPALPDNCPSIVQELIYNILNPKPNKRVSPDIAANVMQLFLWAPKKWLILGGMPSSSEILQWLLTLIMKVMREESHLNGNLKFLDVKTGRRTNVEYSLICSFLSRIRLSRVRSALKWIQDVV